MGRILRVYLFVEHYLTEYLIVDNPRLGDIGVARLSFLQKAVLSEIKGSPEIYLFPGIRRLNVVRNRLVHRLRGDVTRTDRECFLTVSTFKPCAMRGAREWSTPARQARALLATLPEFRLLKIRRALLFALGFDAP